VKYDNAHVKPSSCSSRQIISTVSSVRRGLSLISSVCFHSFSNRRFSLSAANWSTEKCFPVVLPSWYNTVGGNPFSGCQGRKKAKERQGINFMTAALFVCPKCGEELERHCLNILQEMKK